MLPSKLPCSGLEEKPELISQNCWGRKGPLEAPQVTQECPGGFGMAAEREAPWAASQSSATLMERDSSRLGWDTSSGTPWGCLHGLMRCLHGLGFLWIGIYMGWDFYGLMGSSLSPASAVPSHRRDAVGELKFLRELWVQCLHHKESSLGNKGIVLLGQVVTEYLVSHFWLCTAGFTPP